MMAYSCSHEIDAKYKHCNTYFFLFLSRFVYFYEVFVSALKKNPFYKAKKVIKKIINKTRGRRRLIKKKTNQQTCHMSISTA